MNIQLATYQYEGRYYTTADGFGAWGSGATAELSQRECIRNLQQIEPRLRVANADILRPR